LAQTDTIVLPPGTEDRSGSGTEAVFGDTRFQQFFSSALLTPAMPNGALISGISFRRDDQTPWTGEVTFQAVEIILSTTDRTASSFSSLTPIFAENLGPDARTVFSQSRVHWVLRNFPGQANPFDAAIQFSTPFLYDPKQGNLLIDVTFLGGDAAITLDLAGASSVPRDLAFFIRGGRGDPPGNSSLSFGWLNGGAYVTQISYSPIPEPPAVVLLSIGIVAMALSLAWPCRRPVSEA
ncbi:MAG: hypothetical protein AAB393_03330, partial [Bacteroidota bacterium]